MSLWIAQMLFKDRKYHIFYFFGQYWYIKNVPVFTNTRMSQYLGPEVYFSQLSLHYHSLPFCIQHDNQVL